MAANTVLSVGYYLRWIAPAFHRAGGREADNARPFAALADVPAGALLLAPAVAVLGPVGDALAR